MTESDIEALFYKGDYPMAWEEKPSRSVAACQPKPEPKEAPPILPAGGRVTRTTSVIHKGGKNASPLLTVDESGKARVLGDYSPCEDRTLAELAIAILDHLSAPGKALDGNGLGVRVVTYELDRWLSIPF